MAEFINLMLLNAVVTSLLAIVAWLSGRIRAIRERPSLRHFIWVIVLLKLITPPFLELKVIPWPVATPATTTKQPVGIELKSEPVEIAAKTSADRDRNQATVGPAVASRVVERWVLVAMIWASGTLIVLTVAVRQVQILHRVLQRAATKDDRLQEIVELAARRMRLATGIRYGIVKASVSPLLFVGWTGPKIVVPRKLADELTDGQFGCVVAHEIAHYLRRDHWTNLFSMIVTALFWWHPVAWWSRRELRVTQEACCDAMVISQGIAARRTYAETLLQVLEFLIAERSLLPALASGFGGKSSTQRRFEMIANPRVNHRLSWWSYLLLGAALALLPCLPTWSHGEDPALKPIWQTEQPKEEESLVGKSLAKWGVRHRKNSQCLALRGEGVAETTKCATCHKATEKSHPSLLPAEGIANCAHCHTYMPQQLRAPKFPIEWDCTQCHKTNGEKAGDRVWWNTLDLSRACCWITHQEPAAKPDSNERAKEVLRELKQLLDGGTDRERAKMLVKELDELLARPNPGESPNTPAWPHPGPDASGKIRN